MKGQMLKLFVVTAAFLLLAGACMAPPPPAPTAAPPTATPIPPTPTPDLAAPVKIWVDAINNGDAEAALALVSDDVKWQGSFEATGKEQLRAVFDWMIGIELKPQITDCQPQDDRVVCNLTAPDGCKAAFGASSLRSKLVFVFQPDGKVQQASLKPDGEKWAGYWSWLEAEMAWAAANRAEEHAKVGTAPNQREAGLIQIKLCKEYAETLKATPAATSGFIAPVQAWMDALNSGDVDAALALFADDGKYQIHYNARGKEQIRSVFDWLAGLESQSQLTDCQPKDDRVVCNYTVLDACMVAFGTDGLPVKATFIFQDGKIEQAIGFEAGGEWDSYWKFVDAETAWAAANRAEEWAKFRPLSKEFAPVAAKLCKEYGESLK